jgi:hypothetical protein
MARPTRFMQMVDASRDEASLAVRLYNDRSETRSLEGFVVHMHMAWLLSRARTRRGGTLVCGPRSCDAVLLVDESVLVLSPMLCPGPSGLTDPRIG